MISLAGGLPDSALFPTTELAAIAQRVIAEQGREVLQYGETAGYPMLRERFAASMPGVDGGDVVVTTGSQQGLDLLARSLIDPGDRVVVGDPEYLGALQVFGQYQAQLEPIAMDARGLDTDLLERRLLEGLRPKACYVVPNFHNPTGTSMTAVRRRHLALLSDRYGFVVIEDDPYRDLHFEEHPPDESPFNPELHVRLRSVSKTLAPGLRVGALAAPQWLVEAVVIAKQSCDLHTSTLSQAVAAEALASSWYPKHLREMRSLYRVKRDVLIRSLQIEFGAHLSFARPAGGMFLWIDLQSGDTTALLKAALERRVCFVPGGAFAVHTDLSSWARLSFATGSAESLTEGVRRLAQSCSLAA